LESSRKQVREEQVLGHDEFWKEARPARETKLRSRKRKPKLTNH
jgi:hypothetical protein